MIRERGSCNEIRAAHHYIRRAHGTGESRASRYAVNGADHRYRNRNPARLKNPNSAKFSGLVARTIIGEVVAVCGYVNAKNSSGSYIGNLAFDGFLSNSDSWRFTFLPLTTRRIILAQQTCHDWGLVLVALP